MPTDKDLAIKTISGLERQLSDQKKEQQITNAKIEGISTDVRALREATREIEGHLKKANEAIAIKIERGEKRDLVEEKRQKVIEDISTCLKDISVTNLNLDDFNSHSSHAEQDDPNFLKICQNLLSDFVFFMLALLPWILYKNNEKSPPMGYYALLYSVTALAFLGMTGYVLSYIARKSFWIKTVYFITAIAVMSTIALIGYTLFNLIPNDYEHHQLAKKIYLCVYGGIGIFLICAWSHNFCYQSSQSPSHPPNSVHAPMLQ